MISNLVWVYGGYALAILCCAWAFWKGGPVERGGAAIIIAAWSLTLLLQSHSAKGPGNWVVVIDVVTMLALMGLSFRSRSLWTLFAAALQIDAVLSHFAQFLTDFGAFSYAITANLLGGEGLLIALLFGVAGYRRKRKAERAGRGDGQPVA